MAIYIRAAALAALLPVLVLAQPGPTDVVSSASGTLQLERLAMLEFPWGIATLPDGRLLIAEKPGRLRIFANGRLSPPVANVPAVSYRERPSEQGGLLDVAIDPDFARNRRIYLSYSEAAPRQSPAQRETGDPPFGGYLDLPDDLLAGGAVARATLDGNRLRAFDLNSAGIPRRVPSAISWTALVNSAACSGVTLGAPATDTPFRKMKRVIFSSLMKRAASVLEIVFGATGALSVSINIIPALSSSVIRFTRSRARSWADRRQSSDGSRLPLPFESLKRWPSFVSTGLAPASMCGAISPLRRTLSCVVQPLTPSTHHRITVIARFIGSLCSTPPASHSTSPPERQLLFGSYSFARRSSSRFSRAAATPVCASWSHDALR